ncbi:MAG: hypothetical protein ACEY3E_02395 [Candidatus Tisiphia sp.]
MAKKQKFFKNLLASSAIASVVASLGSSNVAFAAGPNLAPHGAIIMRNTNLDNDGNGGGNRTWQTINDDTTGQGNDYNMHNAQQAGVIAVNRPAITYGGNNLTLDADIDNAIIRAINLANHQPGDLTVNENLSIGSIVRDAGTLPIKIVAGKIATLTGTPATADNHGFVAAVNDYTGLGDVELGGIGSTLIVRSGGGDIAVGNVSAAIDHQGILTFETGGTVGRIGANNFSLATVNIGARPVTLNAEVWADNTKLTAAASILKCET